FVVHSARSRCPRHVWLLGCRERTLPPQLSVQEGRAAKILGSLSCQDRSLLHGCGLGDGVGVVTPVPGLVAGTPALGRQGVVTVAVVFLGVPALVLPGGVVEPAGFVINPGCVLDALVPAEAPGVPHGPETVFIVVLDELVPTPGLGLGLACGD